MGILDAPSICKPNNNKCDCSVTINNAIDWMNRVRILIGERSTSTIQKIIIRVRLHNALEQNKPHAMAIRSTQAFTLTNTEKDG